MSSEGMFEMVSRMNQAFGNPKGDPKAINWERIEKQCANIYGEYKELLEALEARDLDAVRDALCDINVFSLGAHHLLGIDANDDMRAVIEGVMTRFCKDEEDLGDTMMKYDALAVDYYPEGSYPTKCLKSARDQTDTNGEFYPKGKFLKSASFREPMFTPV